MIRQWLERRDRRIADLTAQVEQAQKQLDDALSRAAALCRTLGAEPADTLNECLRAILSAVNRMAMKTAARERKAQQAVDQLAGLRVDLRERDRRIAYLAAELDAARAAGWVGPKTQSTDDETVEWPGLVS